MRNNVRPSEEGGKVGKFQTVGEMYFNLPQLQTRLEQIGRVTKDGEKKLQGGAINKLLNIFICTVRHSC